MYTAVALDIEAVNILTGMSRLPDSWIGNFTLPPNVNNLTLRVIDGLPYILSSNANPKSNLLVISSGKNSLFDELPEPLRWECWDRSLRATLSNYEPTVIIPAHWRVFHRGSLVSFQVCSASAYLKFRAFLDFNPGNSEHTFFYSIDDSGKIDIANVLRDEAIFDRFIKKYEDALKSDPIIDNCATQELISSFNLENQVSYDFTKGRTFDDWYQSHLTNDQRSFVDFQMNQSARLKGAAGTGKTLALVIKFLKEIYEKQERGEDVKAAFLAHSFSTVELIRRFISFIDKKGLMFADHEGVSLTITTLHDLANTHLQYDLNNIQPISIDGKEGRELQLEIIQDIVDEFITNRWIKFAKNCTAEFQKLISAARGSDDNKLFCFDVMSEFACVLDTYGAKTQEERQEKYLKEKRLAWMMPLKTASERHVILELYKDFGKSLRGYGVISVDQMVSDYLSFLESFRWDAIRNREGFDFVFVDELHLFNRQERLSFHLLMNNPHIQPVVLMAYDPKQSPRDTFLDMPTADNTVYRLWQDARLGKVEAFQFQDVFRYTPQIQKFLHYLDQSFPAENFGSEWDGDMGKSVIDDGPHPEVHTKNGPQELYEEVFAKAKSEARAKSGGKRVAVICLNDKLFETYRKAGQYHGSFIDISARDQISNLSYAGKRFVLSMPEYVAGLQFETVYLIDANKFEISEFGGGTNGRRKFVSNIYLGASRAENKLEIYCSLERGGLPDLFDKAISNGALLNI